PLEIDHVLIGELCELAQATERLESHRRQSLRLDVAHVPARALYTDHLDFVAKKVARARLHAGVAAALEDKLRIGAEEPCRVGAKREILVHALCGIARNEVLCFGVGPTALHRQRPSCREVISSLNTELSFPARA